MSHDSTPVAPVVVAGAPPTPQPAVGPGYLHHLKQGESLTLGTGAACEVWELEIPSDVARLSEWASRFRQTYCPDSDLDILREGTGKSRAEYLLELVFPDKGAAPGPAIRAGDFAELLVSDLLATVQFRAYLTVKTRFSVLPACGGGPSQLGVSPRAEP